VLGRTYGEAEIKFISEQSLAALGILSTGSFGSHTRRLLGFGRDLTNNLVVKPISARFLAFGK
jgi:hypothetical protein